MNVAGIDATGVQYSLEANTRRSKGFTDVGSYNFASSLCVLDLCAICWREGSNMSVLDLLSVNIFRLLLSRLRLSFGSVFSLATSYDTA